MCAWLFRVRCTSSSNQTGDRNAGRQTLSRSRQSTRSRTHAQFGFHQQRYALTPHARTNNEHAHTHTHTAHSQHNIIRHMWRDLFACVDHAQIRRKLIDLSLFVLLPETDHSNAATAADARREITPNRHKHSRTHVRGRRESRRCNTQQNKLCK